MSNVDRNSLLQFLRVPRFAAEVAEHFGTSEKIAILRLREAIKAGKVLASETFDCQTLKNSNIKSRKNTAPLYISRQSRMLFNDQKTLGLKASGDLSPRGMSNASSIRSASLHDRLFAKGLVNQTFSVDGATPKNTTNSAGAKNTYMLKGVSASEFELFSAKAKLSSRGTPDRVPRFKQILPQKSISPLSHVERIHLLQALFDKPLGFLDLHRRFGISKQIVKGLVKNGVITETWASKGVGVKYKLTKKGIGCLRELEAAAECQPNLAKKAFVRLKMKI